MYKITPLAAVVLLITFANLTAYAQQDKEKKEAEKPKTTTVDAWRNAMPVNEQPPGTVVIDPDANDPEVVETKAQIEKRVLELESSMMEALKGRDSATLKNLLAEDFLLTGISVPAAKSDKVGYIDWALKNLELKTYVLEKPKVRAFPTTAIVTYKFKRQASIDGVPSDGDFVVTNVWVKRGNRWRAVSHHISSTPKP
jgi:ketosteroid isomerase-like protein